PTRASSRLSTRGNIAAGAYPLFSSIQCNLPLNFVSHFWGAVQTTSPPLSRRTRKKGGAPTTAIGGADAEAARGDGGGGVSGEGYEPGVSGIEAVGRKFAVYLSHGNTTRVYKASEIDLLVAYIVPVDAWYVFPVEEIRRSTSDEVVSGQPEEGVEVSEVS
ncbi:MAG: hypothetical protein WA741_06440, partial [Candidatus Sulfotelmatobacter sp.]